MKILCRKTQQPVKSTCHVNMIYKHEKAKAIVRKLLLCSLKGKKCHLYGSILMHSIWCVWTKSPKQLCFCGLMQRGSAISNFWVPSSKLCRINHRQGYAIVFKYETLTEDFRSITPKYKGYQKYKYAFYFHSRPHLEVKQVV